MSCTLAFAGSGDPTATTWLPYKVGVSFAFFILAWVPGGGMEKCLEWLKEIESEWGGVFKIVWEGESGLESVKVSGSV